MVPHAFRLTQKLRAAGAKVSEKNADQPAVLSSAGELLGEVISEMPPEMEEITKLLALAREAVHILNENPVTDIKSLVDAVSRAIAVATQFLSAAPEGGYEQAAAASAALREALKPVH